MADILHGSISGLTTERDSKDVSIKHRSEINLSLKPIKWGTSSSQAVTTIQLQFVSASSYRGLKFRVGGDFCELNKSSSSELDRGSTSELGKAPLQN
jgi:hypothetical protein